jgi:RimJ/RimL family protein N-acetyltransferase
MDLEAKLATPRLWLEPLRPDHAPEIAAALADPAIYRFIPGDPPTDVETLRARHARLLSRRSPDGRELWLNWAVRERATGACVGRVEASVREREHADIAYLFAPAAQGRGLATEACRAMIDWLFAGFAIARVVATIDTRNQRSLALLERLGFRRQHEVRDADFFKGEPSHELVYWLERS